MTLPLWAVGLALAAVAPYGVRVVEQFAARRRRQTTADVLRHAGLEAGAPPAPAAGLSNRSTSAASGGKRDNTGGNAPG